MIELLNLCKWYGCSRRIDIAKGINKMPENLKEAKDIILREWQQRKQ